MSATVTPIVFALNDVYTHSGSSKISLDLAAGIGRMLSIPYKEIQSSQIEQQLARDPQSLVVALNLDEPQLDKFSQNRRVLTIGYSSYFYNGFYAHKTDIFLNPCFVNDLQPSHRQNVQNSGTTVIDYTYTPSRIRPQDDNVRERKIKANPKTIAIYFREPDDAGVKARMVTDTRLLSQQLGFKFLVTTGYSTKPATARFMRRNIQKLPGSEFWDYDKNYRHENSKKMEEFFARADAVAVTYETLSGLSDAANTLLPVFLLSSRDVAGRLWQKSAKEKKDGKWHEEYRLQLALYRQNRLKVFSREAVTSNWTPDCRDEWGTINRGLAGLIETRLRENAGLR